nr:unnamed protein product [Spirometra erinaceieuropaei]
MVESPRLPLLQLPSLCFIQQHGQDDRFVHLEFDAAAETVNIPDGLLPVTESLAGFSDPVGHFIVAFGVEREGGGVEGAVVGDEELMDGSCEYTRLELHPPVVEVVAVRPVDDADPRTFVTLVGGEDHVCASTMTAEVALAFRQESLIRMVVETVERDTGEDLSSDAEEIKASVVVADLRAPFPLVGVDDCGVLEILKGLSFKPHLPVERCQVIRKLEAAMLVNLCRGRI